MEAETAKVQEIALCITTQLMRHVLASFDSCGMVSDYSSNTQQLIAILCQCSQGKGPHPALQRILHAVQVLEALAEQILCSVCQEIGRWV